MSKHITLKMFKTISLQLLLSEYKYRLLKHLINRQRKCVVL